MGIIRGGLVFFVGVLLLILLIVGNILLSVSLSLNYENVNSELVSIFQNFKLYWYYSLFASLILIALMFLLIEKKKNIFINVGILIIISSLPLLALNWIVSSFNFADILFLKANIIFWIVFVLGIILVTVGIGLKFWKFDREVEENSKEDEEEEEKVVKEKVKVKKK